MLPSASTPCPITRQPQWSHVGAIAWIAHSKLSNVRVSSPRTTWNDLSYSFPQTSQTAMETSSLALCEGATRRMRGTNGELRLQLASGRKQVLSPADQEARDRDGHQEGKPSGNVADAEKAVADCVHDVEEWIRVTDLAPRARQDAHRIEDAAEERERQDHDVVDEGVVIEGLR